MEEKLQHMVKRKMLKSVKSSEWASQIVLATKKEVVRICCNYKLTINPVLENRFYYQLPTIGLLNELNGNSFVLLHSS